MTPWRNTTAKKCWPPSRTTGWRKPISPAPLGYGYDDLGRDTLDQIYAEIFGTEDALVRIQFVNGTHAIASALYGALKPGDTLLSAVGAPYDTLLSVIGVTGEEPGT